VSTVLVVDDDKTFTGLLKTVFELEGHQAEILTSPDHVVATVCQIQPALVIMDIHIGQKDTLGVLEELTTNEITKQIPVLMTSGMDLTDKCLDAGAAAFVLKPFRPSELIEIVTNLIGR
jgi:CheY-like chemotaxis protein